MESLALAQPDTGDKLTLEKFADGGIACLRFIGTIDESFEGKKTAATIKGETLLLDLGGVRKISSFGIREWVDFINTASKQATNVVLVECGPKIIDQLNMVANFAGSGRVYSFYAPYRCDYCDAEHRILFTADRDHEAIKSMKLGNRPCPTCKDAMYFDEDPTSFFSYLLSQERFELSPEMESFLASRLNYAVSDVARKLRLDKLIEGRTTYVRFVGDLDASFPREKLADGLEGPVILDLSAIGRIEPAGAAEWRGFVQMVTPLVEQLTIVGAGPSFIEKLTRRDDLGTKAQVLTISLPYRCAGCGTSSTHVLDVDQHYDVIKLGRAPELRCSHCKAELACAAGENVLIAMGMLPRPSLTADARKLALELVGRKIEKKKAPTAASILAAQMPPPPVVRGGGMATGIVSALVAVVLVGGGALAYQLLLNQPASADLGKVSAASEAQRPAWITSDAASSSSCVAADGGLSCSGVSSLAAVQDDAIEEARDVALDAVAEAVAQRIKTPEWKNAAAVWEQSRVAKLGALEANPTSSQARRDVRQARRAVANLLLATSGGAVTPTPAGRYWEERSNKDGKQYLAFARFTVPAAGLERMVTEYGATAQVSGATVVGMFPLVGWRYPEVDHGVIVVGLEAGRLKERGVAEQFVVLEVGGRKVTGTETFARLLPEEVTRLQATGGTLELTVQAGDGAPRAFTDLVAKKATPATNAGGHNPNAGGRNNNTGGGNGGTSGNVNVWDRVGGGSGGRDDPSQ
jgi:anti-anti-sigma regulatory factor